MKNKILFTFLLVGAIGQVTKSQGQVVINEYSCSNKSTITDDFGKYNDWIELYNAGAGAVSIAGYHLTDNPNKLDKFTLPNISVPAGGFVLFNCSGRGTATPPYYHTNFRLTQTRPESIVFSDASLNILDSLTLNPTQVDDSRGRTTNGSASWSLFLTPTPGATNASPISGYVARPVMSVPASFYTGSLNVAITCADPTATIRYTTNGSTPTLTSALYTGTISIAGTFVIRARAFSTNPMFAPSFVESNTYFANIVHNMAVISIFGDQIQTLMGGSQIKPETGLEYFDKTGVIRTETYGTSNEHGNDSWAYAQRGIDYVSGDMYGYNFALQNQLFHEKPRQEFQRIILKAAANDNYPSGNGGTNGPAHIRDQYVNTLSQRSNLHLDERTWEPCVLYVNGAYWGVYDLREKVDDSDFLDYYYKQGEVYDGAPNDIQFIKTWGGTWNEYGGTGSSTAWTACRNYITSNSMAVQANYDSACSMFNYKSLVDYFVLNSFVVTSDWLNWNTAWWKGLNPNGQEKKWRYALWDMDATFGHYINYTGVPTTAPTADPCNPQQLANPGGQGHVPILNALLNNPGFKQYYISRFIDLHNTTLNCTYMQSLLDSMITTIAPEMPRHVAKWGGTIAGWQNNVQDMKDWITARCAAIDSGLIDCYTLNGPYPLVVIADPPALGDVKVNSIIPTSYPFTGSYFGGITVNLTALPNTGAVLFNWESMHHSISPDSDTVAVTINLNMGDTIIAHFSMNSVEQINDPGFNLKVYPSVSNNKFFIEYDTENPGPVRIDIYSVSGKLITNLSQESMKQNGRTYRTEVDASDYGMSSGMYFVSCKTEKGKATRKIVLLPNE